MDKTTKELQKHLLGMLIWFHDFCEKNNIRYYALGGTMLGAARHQGFIPWDDDIDVGIPRPDYEKLISLIGNHKIDHYYLETPLSNNKDYRYPYSKLYDTNTTLTEHTWPILRRGIFIDVFPLDGMGESKEESYVKWKRIIKMANFEWARTCAIRKERALHKNFAILIAHCIPDFIASDKKKLEMMDKLCKESDFDEVKIGGNVFGNWGFKEIIPLSIMGKPTLYKFEDTEIYGSSNADGYLSALYGDWRELPPKEKQVSHHDYLEFNLKKRYYGKK